MENLSSVCWEGEIPFVGATRISALEEDVFGAEKEIVLNLSHSSASCVVVKPKKIA